jgi:hypothetical protein
VPSLSTRRFVKTWATKTPLGGPVDNDCSKTVMFSTAKPFNRMYVNVNDFHPLISLSLYSDFRSGNQKFKMMVPGNVCLLFRVPFNGAGSYSVPKQNKSEVALMGL